MMFAVTIAVLCFFLAETTASNCSSSVSWKNVPKFRRTIYRLTGEWLWMDCTVNVRENVTLWFKKKDSKAQQLNVDNDKVKLASPNVFNITILSKKDDGLYTCKVCDKKKEVKVRWEKGTAFARAIITKEPNKALYDLGDSVKLSCQAEKLTKFSYGIKWYKIESGGSQTGPLKSKGKGFDNIEVLSLNSLSIDDAGSYKCELVRHINPIVYRIFQSVDVRIKVPTKPEIYIHGYDKFFHQGENISLSYNVSSYPLSNIYWWKSSNGKSFELVTQCLLTKSCEKIRRSEYITRTSFQLQNVKYPGKNRIHMYKCNASNGFGKVSRTFQLQIYVKPEVQLDRMDTFEKAKLINCTLKNNDQVNPPQVNYTWSSCEDDKCDGDNPNIIHEGYSLTLPTQQRKMVKYRCTAKNAGGSTSGLITIINTNNIPTKSTSSDMKRTLILIVVPTGFVSILILVVSLFVWYRRKKIFG